MFSFIMRNTYFKPAMQQLKQDQHVVNSNIPNLFCVHHIFYLVLLGVLLTLSGCAATPTSVIEHPTTARTPEIEPPAQETGSIYSNRSHRALFEDRKPRYIGDIITINIVENTIATKSSSSDAAKDGEIDTSVTSLFGSELPKATVNASGASKYSDSSTANSSNLFTGSITTTVIEVLPNGYFLVSGEKQVSFDKGTEFVRFSGVVNPDTVTIGNNVSSTQVADARVEYRTAAKIDAAEVANAVARFFFSVSGAL